MDVIESWVGGDWCAGDLVAERENPGATHEVVSAASMAPASLGGAAVQAARDASESWRARSAQDRGSILVRSAELLESAAARHARDLSREQGKTYVEARAEVLRAAAIMRYFAAAAQGADGQTFPSALPHTRLSTRRVPRGVVTLITPWNFPLAIPTWKIAPALAFGNTVVWKPSEIVPMTSAGLLSAFVEAGVPAGVLNMVLGSGADLGGAILGAEVDAVSFTGSTEVGRRAILPAAAEHGTEVQLELGGKNVAVVLDDADLEIAVDQIARGAYLSAGQKCTATSLALVAEDVVQEVTSRLVATADAMTVGDPLDPSVQVGPLATAGQLARYEKFLDPQAHGGRLLTGRTAGGGGYFVRPAVIAEPDPGRPAFTDEIFAPIVLVHPVAGLAEAIAVANASSFGLTASVFTADLSNAHEFVDAVDTGIVKVNQETAGLELNVPFGGTKSSAVGVPEQGPAAVDFYTRNKTVYLTSPPSRS